LNSIGGPAHTYSSNLTAQITVLLYHNLYGGIDET